jgi:catechol 2,3-dioxygenase-like lactoylglutathione lyase family enzyme
MIHGIHHAAIASADAKALVTFYVDVIGFEVVAQGAWQAGNEMLDAMTALTQSAADYYVLRLGSSHLEIFQYHTPATQPAAALRPVSKQGITHICLQVTQIDDEYQRLSAQGVRFHAAPVPWSEGMRHRAVYCRDLDGNVIELLEIMIDPHPFGQRLTP